MSSNWLGSRSSVWASRYSLLAERFKSVVTFDSIWVHYGHVFILEVLWHLCLVDCLLFYAWQHTDTVFGLCAMELLSYLMLIQIFVFQRHSPRDRVSRKFFDWLVVVDLRLDHFDFDFTPWLAQVIVNSLLQKCIDSVQFDAQ